MKKAFFLIIICLMAATRSDAQAWTALSDEQKVARLKTFRADNQTYLKNTLGMTPKQLDDIDNVNACYLGTLDRINRYAKSDSTKDKLAEAVSASRWVQLDAIMGKEKHDQYAAYLKGKLEKMEK